MADYADAGHRPHASHGGDAPDNSWDIGPYGLTVRLDTWGPKDFITPMADYLQSNWGDRPSRLNSTDPDDYDQAKAWAGAAFRGQTLQQVLEGLSFWFTIDGLCRPATHQIVRSRIGAAFMQHGGRDNDWRHRRFTMPETVRRVAQYLDRHVGSRMWKWISPEESEPSSYEPFTLGHCAVDMAPLEKFLSEYGFPTLTDALTDTLQQNKDLYAALVDAGIPWQDARRFLPMGTQTYIHAIYNYVAVRDVLSKRLEHVMDWEINCIAQLMLREIHIHCPAIVANSLMSMSDRAQMAKFSKLESWPPDGKWPVPVEDLSLPRTHRPEQNPFWVLHPDSLNGRPIKWIRTNGSYPTALQRSRSTDTGDPTLHR